MKNYLTFTLLLFCHLTFSQNLTLDWAKQLGGLNGSNEVYDVAVDSQNNVYSIGTFSNTIDIDPGVGVNYLTSNGGNDFFIQKLSPTGSFIWGYSYGSTQDDWGWTVKINSNDEIILSGAFFGTIDFDKSGNTSSLSSGPSGISAFILKIDNNSNFICIKYIYNI